MKEQQTNPKAEMPENTQKKTSTEDASPEEMPSEEELTRAVKIVKRAIMCEERRYEKIIASEGQEPILIQGATSEGYECMLRVYPAPVAKIFLKHNYPTWHILEKDAPDEMWEELADLYGIRTVDFAGI